LFKTSKKELPVFTKLYLFTILPKIVQHQQPRADPQN